MRILIEKQKRRLTVLQGEKGIFFCRIALGQHPDGPKQREGDGKTPEGCYEISCKNDKSKFYLSLGISYPNESDAQRGCKRGDISQKQLQEIVKKAPHPPWDTLLGGAIFLHGGGTDGDWTKGCIAVENDDMEWLFSHIPIGTKVNIQA